MIVPGRHEGSIASRIFPELQKVLEVVRELPVVYPNDDSGDDEEESSDDDDSIYKEQDGDDDDTGYYPEDIARMLGVGVLEHNFEMLPSEEALRELVGIREEGTNSGLGTGGKSKKKPHEIMELTDLEYEKGLREGSKKKQKMVKSSSSSEEEEDEEDNYNDVMGGEVKTMMLSDELKAMLGSGKEGGGQLTDVVRGDDVEVEEGRGGKRKKVRESDQRGVSAMSNNLSVAIVANTHLPKKTQNNRKPQPPQLVNLSGSVRQ